MKVPFRLTAIDHVVLRVRDLERMSDFYCGVLGCVIEKIQAELGLVQLRAGDSLIDLVDVDGRIGKAGGAAPGPQGHNMDHFCLRIAPFDADVLRRHLDSHGIAPGDVASRYGAGGQGPSLYLTDPEGNTIELKGPSGT